jgi:hypothetical protein
MKKRKTAMQITIFEVRLRRLRVVIGIPPLAF